MEYTIYVFWKEGLIAEEKDAAIRGVDSFANILRSTRAIGMPDDTIRLCGVDAELELFVQNLPKIRGYTDAGRICNHFNAMLPEHAIGVYLTNEPIGNDAGYLVGLTREHSIVSTYHFRGLSRLQKLDSIKLCVMHELGHAHGMAGMYGRVNSEYSYGNHCADTLCLMRQPNGSFAPLIRKHYDAWFCPLCLEDARLTKMRRDSFAREHGRTEFQRSTTSIPRSLPPKLGRPSRLPPPLPPRIPRSNQ